MQYTSAKAGSKGVTLAKYKPLNPEVIETLILKVFWTVELSKKPPFNKEGELTWISMENCPFCDIVNGTGAVSLVHENAETMAFIPLQPIYPGACIVIPKTHIDHFTDVPDELAAKVMITAQQVGRKIREVYKPLRVGMVVHGFGVHHAHLNLIPQYDPLDITYKHLAYIENGEIKFELKNLPTPSRAELDELARSLRFD